MVSLTNTTTVVEGEIAEVYVTANGGALACGGIRILVETVDATASELKNIYLHYHFASIHLFV